MTTLPGCASTPKRIQYYTIDTATDAVQATLRTMASFHATGKIMPGLGRRLTNADRDKALAAYAEYQKVATKAVGNLLIQRTPTPDDIAEVSKAAVDAIFAIRKIYGGTP